MAKDVLPACMTLHCVCAWCLRSPEEGPGSPGARVNAAVSRHVVLTGRADIDLDCWPIASAPLSSVFY